RLRVPSDPHGGCPQRFSFWRWILATECFTVLSMETIAVLLDLPLELTLDYIETTELLQGDGSKRKVHLFHFQSERTQWRGEVDFTYHIRPSDRATSLHSISYSSTQEVG